MPNFHKNGSDTHVTKEMIDTAARQIEEYMGRAPEYDPSKHSGRGVVMIAGGSKYIPCAYVNVKMIRANGCKLPIELWYIGCYEMDERAKRLFDGMDVTFIDCIDRLQEHPSRRIGGWEMNPYAIIHSSFEEVVFLDADNVPLIDVEECFEWDEYKKHHAVFWPDFGRLGPTRSIWKLLNIEYRSECEFESGQIVVNKRLRWKELQLTMCLNEYSDTYYNHIWGDKDTYHMAWRKLGTAYAMPVRGIHKLRATMCQHDFKDNIIFQHRNMDKFRLERTNAQIDGFRREDECFRYLDELRERWDGTIACPLPRNHREFKVAQELCGGLYEYALGGKTRKLELSSEGKIGEGSMDMEMHWYVREYKGVVHLFICGHNMVTCDLTKQDGVWKGRWIGNEMFDVTLTPTGSLAAAGREARVFDERLIGKEFYYVRVGYDKNRIRLEAMGNTSSTGANERHWWVQEDMLCIGPNLKAPPICRLVEGRDGIWRGYWNKYEKMAIELIEV